MLLGGRYRLVELVSEDTWRGSDDVAGRVVTVRTTPRASEAFRARAQALALMNIAGVARVLAVGEEEVAYVVTEAVDGVPLSRLGALAPQQAMALIAAVASVLATLHQQGIVHGPVRAESVFVRPDGTVVLTGFALVLEADGSAESDVDSVVALVRQWVTALADLPASVLYVVGRARWTSAAELAAAATAAGSPPPAVVVDLDAVPSRSSARTDPGSMQAPGSAWTGQFGNDDWDADQASEAAAPELFRERAEAYLPAPVGPPAPPPQAQPMPAAPAPVPPIAQWGSPPGSAAEATYGSPAPAYPGGAVPQGYPPPMQRPGAPMPRSAGHKGGGRIKAAPRRAVETSTDFQVSVGYPRRLAMGFAANFLVQFIVPGGQEQAAQRLAQLFGDGEAAPSTATAQSRLRSGLDIEVELSSPVAEFSAAKRVTVTETSFDLAFWCRPNDSATAGSHGGILTIREANTRKELLSMPFALTLMPYGVAKVSRPVLRRVITSVIVLGSVGALGFSLITQTNETVGVLAGVLGGALSGFIENRTASLYTRNKAVATVTA